MIAFFSVSTSQYFDVVEKEIRNSFVYSCPLFYCSGLHIHNAREDDLQRGQCSRVQNRGERAQQLTGLPGHGLQALSRVNRHQEGKCQGEASRDRVGSSCLDTKI